MLCDTSFLLKIRSEIEDIGDGHFGHATKSFIDDIVSGGEKSQYIVFADFRGNRLTGYLIISTVCDEAEIIQIAVRNEFLKKGIGAKLIFEAFDHCAEKKIVSIFLEVRVSNINAIHFYEKNGFSKTGARKNYYSNPTEDALIMKKNLKIDTFLSEKICTYCDPYG